MKLLNFGDSTLRESFEKKFPKIGVPWLLIKWLSIAALALLVAGLAALAYVFNLLDTAFSKVIRFILESNIGAQEADIKYWVGTITFLLSFFILWLISNLWKHRYILVGLAVALFAFAYFSGVSSNKEVFGEGKDDRFMCPGPTPDHPQTISRTSKNPQAKLPCTKIYNPAEVAVATYLLQMQESKQPLQKPKIVPRFQMLFDDFELMKNGVQLVYKSKALDSEDMPIVYDRPGFDNIAGGLLVPVTLEDLAKIRAHIKQKIEEDQKKKDAAAKEKLDEEKRKADAEAKEKADAIAAAKKEADEKDRAYWEKRYTDIATEINSEVRKVKGGVYSPERERQAKELIIAMMGNLDEAKLKLGKNTPKIMIEQIQATPEKQTPAKTFSAASRTIAVGGNVVIKIHFINRQPPKESFEYKSNKANENRVNRNSEGIYIEKNGNVPCEDITLVVEGYSNTQICKMGGKYKIDPGKVYDIQNNSGRSVFSQNLHCTTETKTMGAEKC